MSGKPPPSQEQQNNGRNEYIPAFISKAPWFAEGVSDSDYLQHQRLTSTSQDTLDKAKWYERGKKVGPAATKFRKGACENCGAMTHKTKDCLSRPRKQGAKWTGQDIQADERIEDVRLGWDAKRDRWNGYDPREYAAVIKEHEELEALRHKSKPTENGEAPEDENQDEAQPIDDSEARYAEETDMGRSQSTATRQLRLREDTAKYLLNLDLDSAKYDPKTRSMDTTAQTLNANADNVAEEGFIRPIDSSSDAAAFERAQRYAWETQESSNPSNNNNQKLHLQANPTEGELLLKKKTQQDSERKANQRAALLAKYGDQSTITKQKPSTLTTASSEKYIEYDPKTGRPKEQFRTIKAKARSKYPEDILTNNHTSVWGSWWCDFQWGYACCHSTVKNSYCTGEQGRVAFEEAEGMRTGKALLLEDETTTTGNSNNNENNQDTVSSEPQTSQYEIQSRDIEHTKNREEIEKLQLEQNGEDIQERKSNTADVDTRREPRVSERKTNKRSYADVTDEEMETYKRNRAAADDPMKAFGNLDENGLLKHESAVV